MGLGISKKLNEFLRWKNVFEFYIRRRILGFENANTILRRIDKNSIISILKANGAVIGKDTDIETPLLFHNCIDYKNLIIGNNCHIGKNCFFDLREMVTIENNVVISMQTTILTHQDFTKSRLSRLYPSKSKAVFIKNDSYVGANSIILMGVTLSEGSFVAAGSVVVKDVEPFKMVGGVPAKFIKRLEFESN